MFSIWKKSSCPSRGNVEDSVFLSNCETIKSVNNLYADGNLNRLHIKRQMHLSRHISTNFQFTAKDKLFSRFEKKQHNHWYLLYNVFFFSDVLVNNLTVYGLNDLKTTVFLISDYSERNPSQKHCVYGFEN